MSINAVDAIDDSLERAKKILFPFDFMDWTRFAVISLFLGFVGITDVFSNIPSSPSGSPGPGSSEALTGMATAMPAGGAVSIGLLIAGSVLLLGLLYLSSVFEFVMFRSVRDKNPQIRANLRRHYLDGLKYLGFNLVYVALVAGIFVGVALTFINSLSTGILASLVAIPLIIGLFIFSGIVHDFALQEMIETKKGLIESINISFKQVTSDWKGFGGYLLFRLLVSWTVGIISFLTGITATALLAIPVIILAVIAGLIAEPLALLVGIIGLLTWLIALLYVGVPFKVYMYSYFVELYNQFMG